MKTIIVTCMVFSALLLISLSAHADQPRENYVNNSFAIERNAIENAYALNLAYLRDQALNYASTIPTVDRLLWADFFRMHGHSAFAKEYFIDTAGDFVQNTGAFQLRTAMVDSFFLTTAADFLLDNEARKFVVEIANSDIQPGLLRDYARCLLPTMESLHMQLVQLQDARKSGLSQLENTAQSEPAAAPQTKPAAPGTINAIGWSKHNAIAAIEGLEDAVGPGETINTAGLYNVKVVQITPAAVTFRKNNTTWTQVVGDRPNAGWTSK